MKKLLETLEKLTFDLHAAITHKDLKKLNSIIIQFQKDGIAIDNAVYLGVSPIFRAIQSGNIDVVRVILDAGASIYTRLKNGRTPLEFAKEDSEIYNLLKNYKPAESRQNREIPFPGGEILFIRPDGDCMYNAIIEGYRRLGLDNTPDLETLRGMVYSRIIHSREDEHNDYISKLELQLINLVASCPRSIETLADLDELAGFNFQIYNIISPYIDLYDSGESILELMRRDHAVERYIETILRNGNWGGNVELWVMSRVLGIEIIVHGPGAPITINNTGNNQAPSVHLNLANNHYNLITHYNVDESPPPIAELPIFYYPEVETIHLDNMYPNDNSITILCVAVVFVGYISLCDSSYF